MVPGCPAMDMVRPTPCRGPPAHYFSAPCLTLLVGTVQPALQQHVLAQNFKCVIVDESHYLKNPKAKRTKVGPSSISWHAPPPTAEPHPGGVLHGAVGLMVCAPRFSF